MKTLIALGCFAASYAALLAAPAHSKSPAQREDALRHARQSVVDQKLDLTDAQKAQVKQIRTAAAAAVRAAKANTTLTPEQRRVQVAEAGKAAQTQFRAVLTPEQQGKLAAVHAKPRELAALAQQRVRTQQILRQLAITPEQQAKIRALRATAVAAAKPIRADTSLTPAQKHAKHQELQQATRKQVQDVLTPAQRTKLQHLRQRLLAPLGPLG